MEQEKSKRNKEYWNRRVLVDKARIINNAEDFLQRNQKDLYGKAEKEIQAEIEKLYQKFADQQKITLAEARQLIRDADFRKIDWQGMIQESLDLREQIRNGNLPDEIVAALEEQHKKLEARMAAYTKRGQISQMELRKMEIDRKLLSLYDQQQENIYNYLHSEYDDGYYRQVYNTQQRVGFGHDFVHRNETAIDKAILNQYQRQNFSKTLYQHCDHFSKDLRENLVVGMIRGENLDKMASRIHKRMGVAYSAARRLVRTETAYVYEQATKDAYEQCDIEYYEYMASLDNKTSEACRGLDGKHFKVKDALPGKNYPPMHPNCRSTTVCWFPNEKQKKKQTARLAKDEDGKYYEVPANMTYKQWQKKYGNGILKADNDASPDEVPVPQLMGKLKDVGRDTCIGKLKELEKEIAMQSYESAYVITGGGKIYRIDGKKDSINISGVGSDSLRNAYVTHNHPSDETRYSFSAADIALAIENRFSVLRGIDDKYEYSISFDEGTVFEDPDVVKHRFSADMYQKVMEMAWEDDSIDLDEDEYHEINKLLAKEYNYSYERIPRRKG